LNIDKLEHQPVLLCGLYVQNIFFGVPRLATCIFLIFYNEPELGAEINAGMVLTPLPSSIGLDRDQTRDLPIMSRVLYR